MFFLPWLKPSQQTVVTVLGKSENFAYFELGIGEVFQVFFANRNPAMERKKPAMKQMGG